MSSTDPAINSLLSEINAKATDPEGLRIKQAIVISVDTGQMLTIRISGSANTVSGVHYLGYLPPAVGNSIWCLRNGPDIFVLGALDNGITPLVVRGAQFFVGSGGLMMADSSGTIGDFLNNAGVAAGHKTGSLVVSGSYADSSPGANGLFVKGPVTLGTATTGVYSMTSTFAANVGLASSPLGGLYRLTSSRRYKVEIKPASIPLEAVKALVPKTYIDKGQYETNGASTTGLKTHLGLIAEEVAEIPVLGDLLVPRDDKGRPESVDYDRLGVLLLPVVQQLLARVESLEAQLAKGDK